MTIIFRCNANSNIGFGHLMRCRALAYALNKKGEDCIMVGPEKIFMNDNDQFIFKEWIPVNDWKSSKEDSNFLINVAKKNDQSYLVLDDYRINEEYQLNLINKGLRWLQFDNKENSRPIWADIILNPMPGIHEKNFKDIIKNKNAKLLLGPAYAILRPEFAKIKKKSKAVNNNKILVTFGGGNDYGGIEFVLSSLIPIITKNYKFIVISGSTNPNNKKIKEWIKNNGKKMVDLYINPKDLVSLFLSCDVAVTAGGTTTYELDCCGLPFFIISTSKNQIEQSNAWDKFGKGLYLGQIGKVSKKTLTNSFKSFLDNKIFLDKNVNLNSYDGLYKVADNIINQKAKLLNE